MVIYRLKQKLKIFAPSLFTTLKHAAKKFIPNGLAHTDNVKAEDFFVQPDFQKSQYFFSKNTTESLTSLFDPFNKICCLCTPRLADEWSKRGKIVTLLDFDARFKFIPGYQQYDLRSPRRLSADFDFLIADPPFSFSASEIRQAVNAVLSASKNPKLCIFFPLEREKELHASFREWRLQRIHQDLNWNNIKTNYNKSYGLFLSCEPNQI